MKTWEVTDTHSNGRFTVLRRGPSSTLLDLDFGNDEDAAMAAAAPDLLAVAEDTVQHIAVPVEKRGKVWHIEGQILAKRNLAAIAKARARTK